uniref:Uncharacterized protein n=1 Tax=Cynoglossus semilaevis TaxID=244447 RepID=A0A3P8UE03_CYNSE
MLKNNLPWKKHGKGGVGGLKTTEHSCLNPQYHVSLLVVRIHVQSLGVQFAQLGENALDVVQVIYSLIQTFHHCLPVVLHTSILPDAKIPLGPGVNDQAPVETQFPEFFSDRHIGIAPPHGRCRKMSNIRRYK